MAYIVFGCIFVILTVALLCRDKKEFGEKYELKIYNIRFSIKKKERDFYPGDEVFAVYNNTCPYEDVYAYVMNPDKNGDGKVDWIDEQYDDEDLTVAFNDENPIVEYNNLTKKDIVNLNKEKIFVSSSSLKAGLDVILQQRLVYFVNEKTLIVLTALEKDFEK